MQEKEFPIVLHCKKLTNSNSSTMHRLHLIILLFLSSFITVGQSIDDEFSQDKMKKDLAIFKEIRLRANSGIYKYRTQKEIDSTYNWAFTKINTLKTYRDFYNVIVKLTNYEGSLHNDTTMPDKRWAQMRKETSGYFPYPIIWVNGEWRVNHKGGKIPLGAALVSINGTSMEEIISNVGMYYTSDGYNLSGKRLGLRTHFARYYRLYYGQSTQFEVSYREAQTAILDSKILESVSYADYYHHFNRRHSRPYDQIYNADLDENQKYSYQQLDSITGMLSVHTFAMGGERSVEHENYVTFLDSVFTEIRMKNINHLIVDVRQNGGGQDPNDLVTYSYLTNRNFQENKKAWISFNKIPLLKYYDINIPKFIRPLVVGKYNRQLQQSFPEQRNGKFYQNEQSEDHTVRTPNELAFTGNVYLLITPAVASAGSLLAAMVAGNENTVTIGEETAGGYYGHNGHTPLTYKLPNSKITTQFSIVNLEQDVPKKPSQDVGDGVLPDYQISQSYSDFLIHGDTQLEFTRALIQKQQRD